MKHPLTYRPRAGRVNWDSPDTRDRIRAALTEGITLTVLARAWGVVPNTMHYHVEVRGLAVLPPDRVSIPEAADALNLTQIGVHALCKRQGVPMGRWGKYRTLTIEQLSTLQARETIVRERPAGYVTVAELQASWGVNNNNVRRRLRGVPRLAWVGDGPRVKFLYHLRDASPHAPRVGPSRPPAGRWGTADVAAALGLPRATVSGWGTTLGAPCIKGRKNRYFDPHALAAWLSSRRRQSMRAHGATLAALLAQRDAA